MAATRFNLYKLLLGCLCLLISTTYAQLLSADFTNCLESAPQAPANQLLNISRVYAQLDTGRGLSGAADDNTNNQALLRLVALGETGIESEGFSNVTNYLATLVVETSLLSFVPHSNQTSLCSSVITAADLIDGNSNITASSFPDPGGCPYGPGPILIGYKVPLGSIGLDDYYPLSTLSTRLRVLDTSVPPLQLACVDVYTTPYYDEPKASAKGDKSLEIYDILLWLPIATFIAYVVVNIIARVYAAVSLTREEREAALASSLTVKLTDPTAKERFREILLETAVGRSVIRSRSLTRFVTPSVGDVIGTFQWIAMVGMCSVVWQGFAYPIFAKMAWSMLLFNTTLVTSVEEHTDPAYSLNWYPPLGFRYNSESLFTTPSSPFYFSASQLRSNLLNIPSTGAYNSTNATRASIYPEQAELQGMASFSAMVGLQPQHLFANCLTFFALILAFLLVISLVPAAFLYLLKLVGKQPKPKIPSGHRQTDSDGSYGSSQQAAARYELPRSRLQSSTARSEIDSATGSSTFGKGSYLPDGSGYSNEGRISRTSHKYAPAPLTPDLESHPEEYMGATQHAPPFDPPAPQHRPGIVRWWAGGDKGRSNAYDEEGESVRSSSLAVSAYYSIRAWLSFSEGLAFRLISFFHLPITIFAVYQLAHATTTSSVISTVFAALVFTIFSLTLPGWIVFRIRRTLTRYLQDDTNTLLSFGPMYNTYAQDSYTFAAVRFTANLIEGCVVGGGQNRATVQVSVILAVEIVETLVTSIWLPWGDGAAQGPLQFILSVSRIIIAVLLIVISPAVNLSFTARGWIGYVIILLAALIVLMLLLILLVKIVELAFRLITKVDFDESRSARHTGLLGALRKKEFLGSRQQRRQRKGAVNARKSVVLATTDAAMHDPNIANSNKRVSRASFGVQPDYESGYLTPSNRLARPQYGNEGEDDTDNIMSAFNSRPQSMAYGSNYYDAGYMPPGSYAAQQAQNANGFRVVRGGRATDETPYEMSQSLPPGAAAAQRQVYPGTAPPLPMSHDDRMLSSTSVGSSKRTRAASQSAIVEEMYASAVDDRSPPASPRSPAWNRRLSAMDELAPRDPTRKDRRLSAPLPSSPSTFPSGAPVSSSMPRPAIPRELSSSITTPGWKRESSTGSGFFHNLFRGPTKSEENEDGWSDSDESESGQTRTAALKRKWIFGKGRNKNTVIAAEAVVGEEDEQYELDPEWEEALAAPAEEDESGPSSAEPSSGKSFQVIRKPLPGPSQARLE